MGKKVKRVDESIFASIMKEAALQAMPAHEAAAAIAAGTITSEALVRACLARIAEREGEVGAWAWCDAEHAVAQARRADAGQARGLLHGVPVAIKDVIDTADMPTEYGSVIYRGHRPAWDAACVAMCRAAGAVILGKTVTAEFATLHPGKTRNPHNPGHTPGGSSSGSAAAVADRMVSLALGTQTGGSTIRPASFCGVVGYKPSYGLINRAGVKPVSESLDTVGTFARTVRDAALLAAAASGRNEFTSVQLATPVRIGIWRSFDWEQASAETRHAVEDSAARLARDATTVRDAHMPQLCSELAAAHHEIEHYELGRALCHEYRTQREALTPKLVERIEHGLRCTAAEYENKLDIARQCRHEIDLVFHQHDVLLTPAAVGEAPAGLQSTGDSLFNKNWTLLGLPCITLPTHAGPTGLPVGVQLVGRARSDLCLLGYALWIERMLIQ